MTVLVEFGTFFSAKQNFYHQNICQSSGLGLKYASIYKLHVGAIKVDLRPTFEKRIALSVTGGSVSQNNLDFLLGFSVFCVDLYLTATVISLRFVLQQLER